MVDHYNPPSKMFARALQIQNIIPEYIDEDEISIIFPSNSGTGPNVVTCNEYGLWNCTCENYQFSKKPGYGEYCCKHILAAIIYVARIEGDLR